MSSAATARRSLISTMPISAGSSGASWQRSRPAGRPRSAGMSNSATIADWSAAPTTPAATGTVRSVRAWRGRTGSKRGRPSCCRCRISMSSSLCRQPAAEIAFQNKRVVYAILFRAAAEAMRDVAAEPRHLGAEIGAVAVLHSWGQTMTYHPHLHCIVPAGGLSPDQTRWVACRPGFLLPVRVLSRRFRDIFVARLRAAFVARRPALLRRARRAQSTPRSSPNALPISPALTGSFTPNRPSLALRQCWPIWAATPIASPSPTLV